MAGRAVSPVMTTKSLSRAKAGVGIHDYGAVRKKGVDGGPWHTMTGWAWSVPHLMRQLLGVA
jgi:hypothetical protein